ncbi:MAG: hypothetical protein JXB00_15660 [Bacteroidales bacterium]|nr:hypothetical protein [Bacteroidales bacterium]
MKRLSFKSFNKVYIDYIILMLVLIAGMWQLVFSRSLMKWDIADINLPWNYYITECINQGILPLWNPYSMFGFPQYGDPGTWYPVKYLIGFIRQYDIYSMHFEYLLHLFLAGAGMYKLSSFHGFSRPVRLIASISYMFSGFFIGNAQHIWWLINAAWLPFGFLFLLRLHKKPSFADAVKLGLVFFFMLSGGYPGLFISTTYLFLVVFLIFIVTDIKNSRYKALLPYISKLSVAVVVFILSALVVLVSSFDFSGHINRGTALPYDSGGILFGAYSPRALLTVLFSYASSYNKTEFWGPDFSMVNTYFGFFSLAFLFIYLLRGRFSKQSLVYALAAVLFLMIAMAEVFPLRKWLYLYVPFMDMFRFASLFRVFFIFFMLLASGFALDKFFTDETFRKKSIRFLAYISSLLFVFLIILFFKTEKWLFKFLLTEGFTFFNTHAGLSERIFLQGVLIPMFSMLLILFVKKSKIWWKYAVVFMMAADMVIAAQLNMNSTVVGEINPRAIQEYIKNLPTGFPVPSLEHSMKTMSDSSMSRHTPVFWRNLGELYKSPSESSFSPYKLTSTQNAIKQHRIEEILELPPVFLTRSLESEGWKDALKNLQTYNRLIKITRFEPGTMEFVTNTDTMMYMVIQQNNYPCWKAGTDGASQTILPVADAFMAIKLGKGNHLTTFTFSNNKVKITFWISLATWIICLILIFFWFIKKPADRKERILRLVLVSVAIVILLFLTAKNKKRYRCDKQIYTSLSRYAGTLSPDTVEMVFNIDNQAFLSEPVANKSSLIRLQQISDLKVLQQKLASSTKEYFLYASVNTPYIPETECLLNNYFPEIIFRKQLGPNYYTLQKRGSAVYQAILFNNENKFEQPIAQWTENPGCLDSTGAYSGKYCCLLDSLIIYSPTFATEISGLPGMKYKHFRISVMVLTTPESDAYIVFDIVRNGKNIFWNGKKINEMAYPGRWQKACMVQHPYLSLKKGDTLKIYIWNNSKGKLWIDDFKIEIVENE